MIGEVENQTDEGLLEALDLMEKIFEENPEILGGLGGSISQLCEHASRRLRELFNQEGNKVALQ